MTVTTASNGRPRRKQLSEQLDRFDAILDGLSEGLTEAVAEAARAGTRLAVQDAVVEILINPALRSQLHQATAPPAEASLSKSTFWSRIKAGFRCVGVAVRNAFQALAGRVRTVVASAQSALRDPIQTICILGSPKRLLILGGGVGVLAALFSYVCPHCLSAAVSGIGAATTAVAVQIAIWARRAFRTLSLA